MNGTRDDEPVSELSNDASLRTTHSMLAADQSSRPSGRSHRASMFSDSAIDELTDLDETALAIARLFVTWMKTADTALNTEGMLWAGRFELQSKISGGMGCVFEAIDHQAPDGPGKCAVKIPRCKDRHRRRADGWNEPSQQIPEAQAIVDDLSRWIDEIVLQIECSNEIDGVAPCLDSPLRDLMEALDAEPNHARPEHQPTLNPDSLLDKLGDQPLWMKLPWYRETLASRVAKSEGRLQFKDARNVLLQLADTLSRLHGFGKSILHRDLKPANILIDDWGKPFLADFGLARSRDQQQARQNNPCGTPAFMSHELRKGFAAEAESEVFAWAVMAYSILTGRHPLLFEYSGEERDRPVSLAHQSDVPLYFSEIIDRCLLQDPAERPASFRAIIEDIANGELDDHAPPLDPPQPTRRPQSVPADHVFIDDLRFSNRWLEYQPNEDVESALRRFIDDPKVFCWWGIVGEGGVGKSRIAQQLIDRFHHTMHVGFLRRDSDDLTRTWLTRGAEKWKPKRPTLIVVDYTVRFADELAVCLKTIATHARNGRKYDACAPIRLLILDRLGPQSAPLALWKSEKAYELRHDRGLIRSFLPENAAGTATTSPHPIAVTGDRSPDVRRRGFLTSETMPAAAEEKAADTLPLIEQRDLLQLTPVPCGRWRSTLETILRRLNVSDIAALLADTDDAFWDQVGRLTGNGRYLFLQMLAVCFSRNPNRIKQLVNEDVGLERLLDDMIQYEAEHHWQHLLPNDEHRPTRLESLRRAMAFITLAGGVTLPQDRGKLSDVLAHEPGKPVIGESALTDSLKKALPERATKDGAFFVSALEPDLLGERLILSWSAKPELESGWDATEVVQEPDPLDDWIKRAVAVSLERTIETVSRIARDFPAAAGTLSLVRQLLSHLERRAAKSPWDDQSAENDELRELSASVFAIVRDYVASLDVNSTHITDEISERVDSLVHSHPMTWRGAWYAFTAAHYDSLQPEFIRDQVFAAGECWMRLPACRAARIANTSYIVWRLTSDITEMDRTNGEATDGFRHIDKWVARLWELLTNQLGTDSPKVASALISAYSFLPLSLAKIPMTNLRTGNLKPEECFERAERLASQTQWENVEEIPVAGAQACINAVRYYGNAETADVPEKWQKLEQWLQRADTLASQWPEVEGIQFWLSRGLGDAVNWYGNATTAEVPTKWEKLDRWLASLDRLASLWPHVESFQILLSEAYTDAVLSWDTAASAEMSEKLDKLTHFIKRLTDLASQPHWHDIKEIQEALTTAASAAITVYGEAGAEGIQCVSDELEQCINWLSRAFTLLEPQEIEERAEEYLTVIASGDMGKEGQAPPKLDVLHSHATGLDTHHFTRFNTTMAETANAELRIALIRSTSKSHSLFYEALYAVASKPQWREIKTVQVHVAVMCYERAYQFGTMLGTPEAWKGVSLWLKRLNALATEPEWNDIEAIQGEYAKACCAAIHWYGSADPEIVPEKWEVLTLWLQRVQDLLSKHKWHETEEIQASLAKACRNAVGCFAAAQPPENTSTQDQMRHWLQRLEALASRPQWKRMPTIQNELAIARGMYVRCYSSSQNTKVRVKLLRFPKRFDPSAFPLQPETIEHRNVKVHYYAILHSYVHWQQGEATGSQLRTCLEEFNDFVAQPQWQLDKAVQVRFAIVCGIAVHFHCSGRSVESPGRWGDLALWLERLDALASSPQWETVEEIQIELARVCGYAVESYGNALSADVSGKWDAVTYWLRRIESLARQPRWQEVKDIQLQLGAVCHATIRLYRKAKDEEAPLFWENCVRSVRRINSLFAKPQWKNWSGLGTVRFTVTKVYWAILLSIFRWSTAESESENDSG